MPEIPMESHIDVDVRLGGDRRHHGRRAASRPSSERRHGDRRRRTMGGLVLAALTLGGVMHQGRPADPGHKNAPTTEIRLVTEAPVQFDRVYDALIAEASSQYGVDPELVRA